MTLVAPLQASPPQTPRFEPWVANGTVRAIIQVGGVIYLGGDFTQLQPPSGVGPALSRNHVAAIFSSTGLPTSWNPNADGQVHALAASPDGSVIYLGGVFTHVGGEARNRIAAASAATGLATPWNPNANDSVLSLLADSDVVYAGGGFTTIGGAARNRIAALSSATGIATAWNPNSNGIIRTMGLRGLTNVLNEDEALYIGGDFTAISGAARNNIAALDTDTNSGADQIVTPWKPNANAPVQALLVDGATVYVGGNFTQIGGQVRHRIAALDAERNNNNALPWNPGANDQVAALARSGNATIFAGGAFTSIGGQGRNHLAELDTTVNTDNATAWNPNAGGAVRALSRVGAGLSAGGEFATIGGNPRTALALFGTSSSFAGPPGGTGFWSQTGTWIPPVVPNNSESTRFDVDIRGIGILVILDIDAVIDSLNLVDASLDITQGSLYIAAPPGIQNLGNLKIGDGRALLALVDITLWGAGPLMLDGPTAMLGGVDNPEIQPELKNAFGHTVAGFGQIVGKFFNEGNIIANMPGEAIIVDDPNIFVNTGLLKAVGGGTVSVGNPEILLRGPTQPTAINEGLIEAENDGVVVCYGVKIEGIGDYLADGGALKVEADSLFDAFIAGTDMDVVNNGVVEALDASTIDLIGKLTLSSGGAYRGGVGTRGTGDSSASLKAEAVEITNDGSEGGELDLDDDMNLTTGQGGVRLIGCGSSLARGCVPPVLSMSGNALRVPGPGPTLTIGSSLEPADFTITGEVELLVEPPAIVTLFGDFVNQCISPSRFNWAQGLLVMGGPSQTFELAGADLGPRNPAGFVDNFAIGTLRLAPGAVVDFVDTFDNVPGSGCEALYVHTLALGAGSSFHLNGCRIYYDFLIDSGAIVDVVDGGALMSTSAGDINGDHFADMADAAMLPNVLLGLDADPAHAAAADLNGDRLIDGSDIAFMLKVLTD
jgi:hypothetical protein